MPGMSPAPDHQFADEETVSYQVAMPADDWRAWKRTVPRTVPLYRRLYQLLVSDTIPEDQMDESDISLLLLKFERVEQRVTNAETALDDGDINRARKELQTIREVAAGMLD